MLLLIEIRLLKCNYDFKAAAGELTSTPFFLADSFIITVSSHYTEIERGETGNMAIRLHQPVTQELHFLVA